MYQSKEFTTVFKSLGRLPPGDLSKCTGMPTTQLRYWTVRKISFARGKTTNRA